MPNDIETLTQFFAAINRNDVRTAAESFDPDIVRIEFEGSPTGGTYRGIAEVTECVARGRGSWAEGTCEPEEFRAHRDKVVVFVHVHVRLKNSPEWIDARFADGFAFRGGKITEYHSFAERRDALKWAGMEEGSWPRQ